MFPFATTLIPKNPIDLSVGVCQNGYWEPDDSDFKPKFNIVFDENGLSVVRTLNKHYLFCFQEESTAHIFLENFSTMLYSVKEYFVLD